MLDGSKTVKVVSWLITALFLNSFAGKKWREYTSKSTRESTLEIPESKYFQKGGKEGIHTEHFGYLLSDLQYMQRTYPDMEW